MHDAMNMIMAPNSRSWFLILFILCARALLASSDDAGVSDILIKFKESLTNADQLNWTAPVVCTKYSSNWNGVICRNGTFVGLRLENMSLGGKIDIDTLSQLPIFSLSVINNSFSGPFPSDINKLTRLRLLFLSNNNFSGEIPDSAFLGMRMLFRVDLAYNMFSGEIPKSLITIPLEILKLQNNQFQGQIPEFWQEGLVGNFSNNELVGAIPRVLSYEDPSMFSGNPGLCGAPLPACQKKFSHKPNYRRGRSHMAFGNVYFRRVITI